MREIFVGDLHGCFDEFMLLLEKMAYDESADRLYLAGDAINRGPKSCAVLDYLLSHPGVRIVMGNHERHFLESFDEGRLAEKMPDLAREMGNRAQVYADFIRTWPYYIESPLWMLVHAGLLPGTHPSQTDPEVLCNLRHLPGTDTPWFEVFQAGKPVIFGHWAKRGLVRKGLFSGLDSGCVYGKELTALILPEDAIVSVPALRMYYHPVEKRRL